MCSSLLQLFDLLGPPEFLPSRRITADLFGEICKTSPDMCVSVLTAIAGFNGKNINMTRMPDYVEYAPSGGASLGAGELPFFFFFRAPGPASSPGTVRVLSLSH